MAGIRRDVATLGPGWNDTLLWYARAVAALQAKPISDPNSWSFLGAIHGFNEQLWRANGVLRAGETVPPELRVGPLGNQCQHGSWYFLPWHRGYLAAFEAIVSATITSIGGPQDWSLPYWNYFDTSKPDAKKYPAPFLAPTLPDGSPNPLSRVPRRNVQGLTPLPGVDAPSLQAMAEPDFLADDTQDIGFGGGVDAFAQFGDQAGDLEANPHNPIHVLIGGFEGGFMSNARLAGLDPIFWLHHCNIDRLWEAWMWAPGREMAEDPRWLNGPTNRKFMMPGVAGGAATTFRPLDTLRGGALHPQYDTLTVGTGVTIGPAVAGGQGMGTKRSQSVDVIGASQTSVTVGDAAGAVPVKLDAGAAAVAVTSMGPIEAGKEVVRLYLRLENIKGESPSAVIDVFVNLPAQVAADERSEYKAGSLYLFGLDRASETDGTHAGNGLGFTLDITDLAERLNRAGKFDPANLDIFIQPQGGSSASNPVTVERISVLRRKVKAND